MIAAAVVAASDGAFAVFYRTAVDADPTRASAFDAAAVRFESAALAVATAALVWRRGGKPWEQLGCWGLLCDAQID